MAYTIAGILADRCADENVDVADVEEIALDPGVSAQYRLPASAARKDLFIVLSPPQAPVVITTLDANGVYETDQGVDGDARVAISRAAFRARYSVSSDAEADRRVWYIIENDLDIIASTDATTGKHLVIGVGLVPN